MFPWLKRFTLNLEEVIGIDETAPTEDDTEMWEQTLVDTYTNDSEPPLEDCESESEPISLPGADMTLKDVLDCPTKLKNFAIEKQLPSSSRKFIECELLYTCR